MSKELDKRVGLWCIKNSHYGVNPVYGKDNLKNTFLGMITKVVFNDPATIVFWNDGSKTVVKCNPEDKFDPEKGLAIACMKKLFGNKGYYNDIFRKWLPEEEDEKSLYSKHPDDVLDAMRFSAASIVANSAVFKNAVQAASREADNIYNQLLYGTEEEPDKKVNFKDVPSKLRRMTFEELGKLADEKEGK